MDNATKMAQAFNNYFEQQHNPVKKVSKYPDIKDNCIFMNLTNGSLNTLDICSREGGVTELNVRIKSYGMGELEGGNYYGTRGSLEGILYYALTVTMDGELCGAPSECYLLICDGFNNKLFQEAKNTGHFRCTVPGPYRSVNIDIRLDNLLSRIDEQQKVHKMKKLTYQEALQLAERNGKLYYIGSFKDGIVTVHGLKDKSTYRFTVPELVNQINPKLIFWFKYGNGDIEFETIRGVKYKYDYNTGKCRQVK